MEGHCSKGQSPQRAVVPMKEEEEDFLKVETCYIKRYIISCVDYLCNNYKTAQRDVFGPG